MSYNQMIDDICFYMDKKICNNIHIRNFFFYYIPKNDGSNKNRL